ncbi:MAG: hypothetical protein MJZ99_10910 [Bacteroidales bacterium]|nr:hypothetical protein [Candidatus Colimorpha merdihippi]MCQ2283113.1 hypothetical protein [Bacteroidales bacterium]
MKASYKILLITLLLLLIFAIGCIPLVIVLFMYQTLFVRTIIALSGLVWGVLTIYYVWSRTRYTRQWHLWRYERRYKRLTRHRRRHPDYMALYSQYPKSLRRWEQHCLHKGYAPDKTIALALKVSPSEWAEREAFRQQQ